jgi:hypothetical protein
LRQNRKRGNRQPYQLQQSRHAVHAGTVTF